MLHTQWMKWLVQQLRARGVHKCVLVLDSFKAHFAEQSRKLARDNDIMLMIIPGGLTSILQPLDVRVNAIFKQDLRKYYLLWLEQKGGPLDARNLVKLMDWQDLLTIIQYAWDEIEPRTVAAAFQVAGLGLRLDGTEDDLVWNSNHEYEEHLRAQRTRTLEHERKAASSGSASSSSKASKQQVREQEEALSKRERRVAKMQLAVPGDEDGDAEIVPNA